MDAASCVGGFKYGTSAGHDMNGDGQADMFCFYSDTTSTSDCDSKFTTGTSTFRSSTCAEKSDAWRYSDLAELTALCAEDELGDLADNCCSDQISVCDQIVSQLCETNANYLPNAIGSTDCFQVYATTAEFDAESCDGGRKYGVADGLDLDEDGVTDLICVYYTTNSQAV